MKRPVQSIRIELICFGTELLHDKVNTNVITIGKKLSAIGLSLSRAVTVGDQAAEIQAALNEAIHRSDVVITSGGLGPTFDDLTRECVARVLKRRLKFSTEIMKRIEKRFRSVKLPMPEENRKQAYRIEGAQILYNQRGTAPGQILKFGNKTVILLPGPPNELVPMVNKHVLPYLKKVYPQMNSRSLILHIFGRPESEIDEKIAPVVERNRSTDRIKVTFGILAHHSVVDVKMTVVGSSGSFVLGQFKTIRSELYKVLGDTIYGENDDTLESVIGKNLRRRGETLSVAESCTGGLIAHKLTDVPGSSAYFLEGAVTYSNESKIRVLNVSSDTLIKFGAVSEHIAKEMSQGILRKSGSDWAVSVTGIAGPGGGSSLKPVGQACFCVSFRNNHRTYSHRFYGSRSEIKEKSALTALELLRQKILLHRA